LNYSPRLGTEILQSVSRSFYLSIRWLPRDLRAPISIAYLLARIGDTIADSESAAAELRLQYLRAFGQMIEAGSDPNVIDAIQRDIQPESSAERNLLRLIAPCLDWYRSTSPFDQSEIASVLTKILHGQELDLLRAQTPLAEMSAEDLDEYTYLVAGCVGEFWTRVCFHHVSNFSRIDQEKMTRLGMNYGKGLQLINILRDLPIDLASRRCYLPAEELEAVGVVPAEINNDPSKCGSVFLHWCDVAAAHLDDGFAYIEAINNIRVRLATLLPWLIGGQTLSLLRKLPPLETARRIKVSRNTIRFDLLVAPFLATSNFLLARARTAKPAR
jgi:farnesyl-diphosphate farnesyltransferase